jgi:phosphate transport system protein
MKRTELDHKLNELEAQMIRLGALVESALRQALEALATRDLDKAEAIVAADVPIDDLHLAIEQHTFRVLRMQLPLGERDLRYLVSLVPITIDLERIGDEAEEIAQIVLRMQAFNDTVGSLADLPSSQLWTTSSLTTSESEMPESSEASILQALLDLGQQVRSLLQRTLKAFTDRDAETARCLWDEDKTVDKRSYGVQRDLMTMLEGFSAVPALQCDSHFPQRAAYLLRIAHNVERSSDHCTNICERIVYIVQGETDMHPLIEEE